MPGDSDRPQLTIPVSGDRLDGEAGNRKTRQGPPTPCSDRSQWLWHPLCTFNPLAVAAVCDVPQTVAADAGALRVLERLGDAVIRVRVDAPRRLQ